MTTGFGLFVTRRARFALFGAGIGATLSLATYFRYEAMLAAGGHPAAVGFEYAHLLLFLGFPSSLLMLLIGGTLESAGVTILSDLVLPAMPIVGFALWGLLASYLRGGSRSESKSRPVI